MFSLTPTERKVLLFVGGLILVGSLIRFFNVSQKVPSYSKAIHQPSIININTASSKELERIPGIGGKTASRIIEYRNRYGRFRTLKDLKKVKGIGDKKAQSIKPHITF